MENTLKLDRQGRLQLSKSAREGLNIKPGDEMVSWLEGKRLIVEPRHVFEARVKKKYKGGSGHEVEDFIRERRLAAAKDLQE